MGPLKYFLFVYILGGITCVPLVLGLLFLFVYFTSPDVSKLPPKPPANDPAQIVRDGDLSSSDEQVVFKTSTDDLAEKFHRKHDSDVAAGYFAVCREYVPGGVNGKPPDKLSPAGEVVAQESPSVYQSMYRSIFDRSQRPTIEPNKDTTGKSTKKANNVFYVVLRHGHLMLYDDIQQLEVRYVILLEYHDVDIYAGGGEEIREAELWMKRNAIQLKRKPAQAGDKVGSLPFFFFSENSSEKEDFYHAILRNQEKNISDPPVPQEFETRHIISLVQKLHSSEEQLQTRWLNALVGRVFLAIYKTPFVEQKIRDKLTKKISRVKKPNFITRLALQKIDLGESAPFLTNPRLKDLTVNGDCLVEADVDYTGSARIEIAATARIDLGSRFKAREVEMVLAATCKRIQGRMLFRLKPPPSNRMWFAFEKMPKIEMTLEPVVSTRQITYTVILRALESRIMEVIAETLVLPFWDDVPFMDTEGERYRGGIWKKKSNPNPSTEIKDEDPEDEAEAGDQGSKILFETVKKEDRTMSMPVLTDKRERASDTIKAAKKSISTLKEHLSTNSPPRSPALPPRTETSRTESSRTDTPRILRSPSFASVVNPAVSPAHAGGNTPAWDIKAGQKRDSMLKDLSQRPFNNSPTESNAGSLPTESAMPDELRSRKGSTASRSSLEAVVPKIERSHSSESQMTIGSTIPNSVSSLPRTDTDETMASEASKDSGRSRALTHEGHLQEHSVKHLADAAKLLGPGEHKPAINSINAAASAAQKWGWGVIARNHRQQNEGQATNDHHHGSPSLPMGRGQPLPPPGTPLPPPVKPSLFSLPKRKPVAPQAPPLPKRPSENGTSATPAPKQPPLLPERPERRRRQTSLASNNPVEAAEEILVVAAPAESTPTTPLNEHHDEFFGHGEHEVEKVKEQKSATATQAKKPPSLPTRKSMLEPSTLSAISGGAPDSAANRIEVYKDKDV